MADEPEPDTDDADDDNGAETFLNNSGPTKNEMTDKWLPDPVNWLVKTFLDRGDAQAISGIHATAKLNPETSLGELNEEILPEHYQALIGEEGKGWNSHHEEVMALHGKTSDDDDSSGAVKLVAADADE